MALLKGFALGQVDEAGITTHVTKYTHQVKIPSIDALKCTETLAFLNWEFCWHNPRLFQNVAKMELAPREGYRVSEVNIAEVCR